MVLWDATMSMRSVEGFRLFFVKRFFSGVSANKWIYFICVSEHFGVLMICCWLELVVLYYKIKQGDVS